MIDITVTSMGDFIAVIAIAGFSAFGFAITVGIIQNAIVRKIKK